MERTIEMYNNMVHGERVSDYGLERGYLDYQTLANIVGDCILNNVIRDRTLRDWDKVSGEFTDIIFSDYIISEKGYEFLKENTDELVFYNENLDIYVWAVDHYGTKWSDVSTGIKLVEMKF